MKANINTKTTENIERLLFFSEHSYVFRPNKNAQKVRYIDKLSATLF
ncbi:hypothetical protein HMPREF1142_1802 [Peptostreptococcaceae bacterium AS15]|nr:hypothetical protein HMPREF1142_1802 [Peptostreptococcaceae bacterium AS15]